MSGSSWDDMRKAKEESYFDKKNREALERLAAKQKDQPRLSPISGEPMVQEVIYGVVIDRCPSSGGVWLDAGELEQMIKAAKGGGDDSEGTVIKFFKDLAGRK